MAFLQKPFTMEHLARKIRQVLEAPRKTRYRRVVTFAGQEHLLAHHGGFG